YGASTSARTALAATSTMKARPASAARFRRSRRQASPQRLWPGPNARAAVPARGEGALAGMAAAVPPGEGANGGGRAARPGAGPGMAAGAFGTTDRGVALGSDAIFTRSPRRPGQHRRPRRAAPLLFEPAWLVAYQR